MIRTLTKSYKVKIPIESFFLEGELIIPADAKGVVLSAHESRSNFDSRQDDFISEKLMKVGLGTLSFDLLTESEKEIDARTRHLRFDIDLLARRLIAASNLLKNFPELETKKIGFFVSGTGGAAALIAAFTLGERVGAIVSRGGRPDLAGAYLRKVKSPILLIIGGRNEDSIAVNKHVFAQLRCEKEMKIVPGATHLFEEPGKFGLVAHFAAEWFRRFLIER